MKRKYKRYETFEAIVGNIERERQTEETEGPSTNFEETEEIGKEISNDAEESTEDDEALGRGRRQRRQPKKYSYYVL